MHLLIASENRLAGLSLLALGEAEGLTTEVVSLGEARARADGPDLVLVYFTHVGPEQMAALEDLRSARVPFVVVCTRLDPEARHAVLAAGALYAFEWDDSDEIALALGNYVWAARPKEQTLTFANGFTVDLQRRRLQRDGRYLDLTATECQLLEALHGPAKHSPGKPVSLPEINMAVWGVPDARAPTTVRGYVCQLRAKVEVRPERPAVLLSRRYQGYWLVLGHPEALR